MSYEFSKREKILLLILVLGLIVYGWYRFVYKPVNDEVAVLSEQTLSEQTQTTDNLLKIQEMKTMENEITELKADENVETTPVYDNRHPLMVSLNRILLSATSYSLSFGDLSSVDYVLSRPIYLTFSTDSYSQARMIIDRLSEDSYCNQISDVVINTNTGLSNDTTKVTLTITFYEILE